MMVIFVYKTPHIFCSSLDLQDEFTLLASQLHYPHKKIRIPPRSKSPLKSDSDSDSFTRIRVNPLTILFVRVSWSTSDTDSLKPTTRLPSRETPNWS